MEDNRIITLYNERNESAITETKEKYGKLVYRVSYEILRNNEDTEECENTTYLNTWNSIPPAKPVSLCAYICTIARNTAINLSKKLSRHKAENIFDELEEIIGDHNNPQELIEEARLVPCINKYLKSIKSRNRQIFTMRYYFEMSVEAIGDCFGLSTNAVYVQLKRTREGLRAYLKENGIDV